MHIVADVVVVIGLGLPSGNQLMHTMQAGPSDIVYVEPACYEESQTHTFTPRIDLFILSDNLIFVAVTPNAGQIPTRYDDKRVIQNRPLQTQKHSCYRGRADPTGPPHNICGGLF